MDTNLWTEAVATLATELVKQAREVAARELGLSFGPAVKQRAQKKPGPVKAQATRKPMSAAARKRMSQNAKKRWAEARKRGENKLS